MGAQTTQEVAIVKAEQIGTVLITQEEGKKNMVASQV